jgi:hypothetical protein
LETENAILVKENANLKARLQSVTASLQLTNAQTTPADGSCASGTDEVNKSEEDSNSTKGKRKRNKQSDITRPQKHSKAPQQNPVETCKPSVITHEASKTRENSKHLTLDSQQLEVDDRNAIISKTIPEWVAFFKANYKSKTDDPKQAWADDLSRDQRIALVMGLCKDTKRQFRFCHERFECLPPAVFPTVKAMRAQYHTILDGQIEIPYDEVPGVIDDMTLLHYFKCVHCAPARLAQATCPGILACPYRHEAEAPNKCRGQDCAFMHTQSVNDPDAGVDEPRKQTADDCPSQWKCSKVRADAISCPGQNRCPYSHEEVDEMSCPVYRRGLWCAGDHKCPLIHNIQHKGGYPKALDGGGDLIGGWNKIRRLHKDKIVEQYFWTPPLKEHPLRQNTHSGDESHKLYKDVKTLTNALQE